MDYTAFLIDSNDVAFRVRNQPVVASVLLDINFLDDNLWRSILAWFSFTHKGDLHGSTDYVDYGHEPPGRGLQGAKSDYQDFTQAFADARFDVDEMFGSDDRVVVRWTLHATHTGPFAGHSPTQKKATVRGISLYRLRDEKITETRNQADLFALFMQLGTIERRKSATA